MAKPFLTCPSSWRHSALEPNPLEGLIEKVSSGGTPKTGTSEFWDGDVPWLTPREVASRRSGGMFFSKTERTITNLGLKGSGAKLLPINTVMLTKRAPVGAVAVNAIPMSTNQGFLNFQCGPYLRPLYLAYWLQTNKPYLEAVANGSTYPELYTTDLFEFEIAVPSVQVQDRIINVVNAVQLVSMMGLPLEQAVASPEELLGVQAQNERLSHIQTALLPLLLCGELDVEDVSTELASLPAQL